MRRVIGAGSHDVTPVRAVGNGLGSVGAIRSGLGCGDYEPHGILEQDDRRTLNTKAGRSPLSA
jgi:hypothetical protein